MSKIDIPPKESSHSAFSEDLGECGELKSPPCSNGVKTHYTNDLLSSAHFKGPGPGAEINSPHSPLALDDTPEPSGGVDLCEGECPKSTFPPRSSDGDIESDTGSQDISQEIETEISELPSEPDYVNFLCFISSNIINLMLEYQER
jgi:hypothetical protein